MTAKILFILPCNSGAKEGDYFPHGGWKQTLLSLRKYSVPKELVDLAAVDSIITVEDPAKDREAKGAIVTEYEMERVKGFDIKPEWHLFEKNNYSLLHEHTNFCQIGLRRLIPRYQLILIVLNVRGYKYATVRALRNLSKRNSIPSNVIVIDCGESPSFLNNGISEAIKIIVDFIKNNEISWGKILRPSKIKSESRFLYRPKEIPKEFEYWQLEDYMVQE